MREEEYLKILLTVLSLFHVAYESTSNLIILEV